MLWIAFWWFPVDLFRYRNELGVIFTCNQSCLSTSCKEIYNGRRLIQHGMRHCKRQMSVQPKLCWGSLTSHLAYLQDTECARIAIFHDRSDVDEDNAEHEKFAISLRDQLIRLMEDKVAEMSSDDMFLPKLKLQETVLQFRQMYGAHPMNLVRIIKNCLSTEMKMVQDVDSVWRYFYLLSVVLFTMFQNSILW